MEEYVFLLEPTNKRRLAGYHGRTQTIWATSKEDAEERLQSWKQFGYDLKYLHTMEEFKQSRIEEEKLQAKLDELHGKRKRVSIEVENV